MPTIDTNMVERLWPLAVRGTLTPGLYRHVYNPGGTPWYEDIYVSEAHILPSDPSYHFAGEIWYAYTHIDPTRYGYGKHSSLLGYGSLKAAGVIPQVAERRNARLCDLGHTHIEVIPAKYNCNFLVPLSEAVEVK